MKIAFEKASWTLNPLGLAVFDKCVKMLDQRREFMKIDGNILTEEYKGRKFTGTRQYTTDQNSCTCTWFQNRLFCRHPIFFREQNNLPLFSVDMFNKRLLKHGTQLENDGVDLEDGVALEDIESEGQEVDGDNIELDLTCPASPGMEELLDEERASRKKPKENERYVRSLEAANTIADKLSQYETKRFDMYLKAAKNFSNLLHNGLPDELVKYLENPEKYSIVSKPSDTTSTISSVSSSSAAITSATSSSGLRATVMSTSDLVILQNDLKLEDWPNNF